MPTPLVFKSLYDLFNAIPNEKAAIAHFTAIRWARGEFCPYCGGVKLYHFKDGVTHKCADPDCRQRFSIKVRTIFEDTKIPLRKWLAAIWLITSHRKGIASTQLARDIAVTQKTAWFMLHRLRHAARTRSFNRRLRGDIEVDETFVGGKEHNKHASKRTLTAGGRSVDVKTPVVGVLERGGELRAMVIPDTRARSLHPFIKQHVAKGANLYSDDYTGYRGLDKDYNHQTTKHSTGEYVRGRVHTQSIEGVWALLKRQIIGIHHWVSPKHLNRYVGEVAWRFNLRDMPEADRMRVFLTRTEGRLRYVDLIAPV